MEGVPDKDRNPMSQYAVGLRLRDLRLALGYTQEFMADLVGLSSPSGWTNYELGNTMIPPDKAAKVCILSGCNFNFIYAGEIAGLPHNLMVQIRSHKKAP